MGCVAKAFEFYSTDVKKKLEIRCAVYNPATDCKEPLDLTGATAIQVELPASPNNITLTLISTPAVVVDEAKLGKISVVLEAAQLSAMINGSVVVKVTRASGEIVTLVAEAAARKLTIPNC